MECSYQNDIGRRNFAIDCELHADTCRKLCLNSGTNFWKCSRPTTGTNPHKDFNPRTPGWGQKLPRVQELSSLNDMRQKLLTRFQVRGTTWRMAKPHGRLFTGWSFELVIYNVCFHWLKTFHDSWYHCSNSMRSTMRGGDLEGRNHVMTQFNKLATALRELKIRYQNI